MIYLKSVKYLRPVSNLINEYPFCISLINNMDVINFNAPVTIVIGENGTGKSTLLEALACSIGAITVGNDSVLYDKELADLRKLAQYLKLSWTIRTGKGFFLRAEDFISYTNGLTRIRTEMLQEVERVEEEYKNHSAYSRALASLPFKRSLHEMEEMYGGNLNERSHGEGFLTFFGSRLKPDSLYILDEPETPLSPMNQVALMSMINEMVRQNCQFIIATHSPIIMAFPGASIYEFNSEGIKDINYNEIESVKFYKSFLNNPDKYLRLL